MDVQNLPEGASQDFTHTCGICGATITVVASQAQPHVCRIEIS